MLFYGKYFMKCVLIQNIVEYRIKKKITDKFFSNKYRYSWFIIFKPIVKDQFCMVLPN